MFKVHVQATSYTQLKYNTFELPVRFRLPWHVRFLCRLQVQFRVFFRWSFSLSISTVFACSNVFDFVHAYGFDAIYVYVFVYVVVLVFRFFYAVNANCLRVRLPLRVRYGVRSRLPLYSVAAYESGLDIVYDFRRVRLRVRVRFQCVCVYVIDFASFFYFDYVVCFEFVYVFGCVYVVMYVYVFVVGPVTCPTTHPPPPRAVACTPPVVLSHVPPYASLKHTSKPLQTHVTFSSGFRNELL